MSDDKPPQANLTLSQEPAGLLGTRLRLSGRLNLAVAGLLLGWTDDICIGELGDVELDLTALDSSGALGLTTACGALRRSRRLAFIGAEPPGPTVKVPDGCRP